ncbi:MAG: hypothetical protein D6689_22790 [Deltaproteobacteria bacterium]|nr:MAG: hypothetical protein D6689_22790 [Deltaproteobacteria bacterium]
MALYAAASAAFFAVLYDVWPRARRAAKWLLLAALVAHGADIAARDLAGVHPGTSVRESIGALSWLVAAGFLAASMRYRIDVLGAFVAPAALILLAAARLTPSGEPVPGLNAIGRVHISLAMVAVALFALATALAVVYLLEARNLKRKRFDGLLFRRGIALETLDLLLHRLIVVGFPVLTVSMMLGAMWAAQRSVNWYERPEYGFAMVTWLAFGGVLVGRVAAGWRGRKTAALTIAGFVAALAVLLVYLARRSVG